MNIDPELVLTLMSDIEREDPIDWGMLNIDESAASRVIVLSMIEQYKRDWITLNDTDRAYAILATVSKLALENFVLNVRLYEHKTKIH